MSRFKFWFFFVPAALMIYLASYAPVVIWFTKHYGHTENDGSGEEAWFPPAWVISFYAPADFLLAATWPESKPYNAYEDWWFQAIYEDKFWR